MWIIAKEGFVSIVAHRDNANWVLVRARAKADIEYFAEQIDQMFGGDANVRGRISSERPSDYEYRMWVTRAAIALVIAAEVDAIDYTNFKSSVRDGFRHDVYMSVWTALSRIGDRTRRDLGESKSRWGAPWFGRDKHPGGPYSGGSAQALSLIDDVDDNGYELGPENSPLFEDLHKDLDGFIDTRSTDREVQEWESRGFTVTDGPSRKNKKRRGRRSRR
jgi:hypothetical protein